LTDVADLDPTSQMLFWTGTIVRNDVQLEHELSGVYARLATGLAWAAMPTGVAPLVTAIRRMLNADEDAHPLVLARILALLNEISEAHAERNRLVHDLWWGFSDGDSPMFDRRELRGQNKKGPSTRHLNDFKSCADQLSVLAFRTVALQVLLRDRDDSEGWPEQHNWWRVLTEHVEVTAGGGYRVTDKGPA
jgi:hypothetical protein